ncbi:MAG: AsmA family protein [Methylophilaceae bacterium]
MNKIVKYALFSVGGIITLFLLVAAYFAATFNPNDYKGTIIKLVQEKKERTLKIDGDIKLTYWPKIGADLGKISLSEQKSDAEFASVNSVKVSLAVLPLLKKELVVDTVYVDGAKANIIKHQDGTLNIDDLMSKEKSETIKFDIDGVNVSNSEAHYTDEASGAKYALSKFNLKSGHIALAEPVDLATDFTVTSNKPELTANANIKGNFLLDPETKHFKVKGLDSHILGDMLGGKGMDIVASGDVDAKPEKMEFLVDGLKLVVSGTFGDAKQGVDLSAPSLSILKDEVSGKKVTVILSQDKNGDTLKANMVLADMKGSPKALQSSGITGELSAVQGKRTVLGTFSSPFSGDIENLIFDLPKLAGNLDIKDPSLPNGGMKGTFNLAAHTDIKKQLANSNFNLAVADSKLVGDFDLVGFDKKNIKFNLSADKLDLNNLMGKSSSKPSDKPADMSALKSMTIDGKLNIGSLIYDKYHVSNLNVGIKADGDKLILSGLDAKLDDSKIKGNLGISHFAKPVYEFDLDIDSLDVDKYTQPAPAQNKASGGGGMTVLKTLLAEGKLRIGSLKYGKYRASNLSTTLKSDGEKFSLNPFSGKVDDSEIKGNFAISQYTNPKYTFDLDIDNLDIDKYAAAASSSSNAPAKPSDPSKPADLSALKALNADGSLRVGHLKYGKTNASNVRIDLKSDGQKLSLNPLSAKIDDSQINAKVGVSRYNDPIYNFDVNIDKLDADRYIAKGDPKAKSSGDTPIDLSPLKKLNATGEAKIGWLKLANVKTENVRLGLKADGGIATLSPFAANLYQGSMEGTLKVDARATPNISFKQNMKGVSIGPLLVDAIHNDMLSGTGTVNVDVTTSGNSVGALKKGLNGSSSLNLADGALKGVDIAGSIRELKSKVNFLGKKDASADKTKKTDFSELTATFDIKNGVAHNEDLAMKAPVLRLAKGDSRGDINIGNETINYTAKPTVVKSLKGQGGAELDNLSGIPIPIKITGTFSDPKYGMDFSAIATGLAQSKLIDKVGGDKADALKGALNGDPKDALKGLFSKKKPAEIPADATATPAAPADASAAPAAPAEAPASPEDKAKAKLKKLLKF